MLGYGLAGTVVVVLLIIFVVAVYELKTLGRDRNAPMFAYTHHVSWVANESHKQPRKPSPEQHTLRIDHHESESAEWPNVA